MSKNVALSDDVYERLKKEKGDKSFSDIIREKLDSKGKIADVAGMNIFEDVEIESVKYDIEKMSKGTKERMEV